MEFWRDSKEGAGKEALYMGLLALISYLKSGLVGLFNPFTVFANVGCIAALNFFALFAASFTVFVPTAVCFFI